MNVGVRPRRPSGQGCLRNQLAQHSCCHPTNANQRDLLPNADMPSSAEPWDFSEIASTTLLSLRLDPAGLMHPPILTDAERFTRAGSLRSKISLQNHPTGVGNVTVQNTAYPRGLRGKRAQPLQVHISAQTRSLLDSRWLDARYTHSENDALLHESSSRCRAIHTVFHTPCRLVSRREVEISHRCLSKGLPTPTFELDQ